MKEKVLSIVGMKGPLLPLEVSKALNLDSIMSGAYLSELYSNKRLKLSYLKIGGSPLYYVDGQESKLQNYTHVLKAPEKKAYELLKEKKVVKDSELEPVTRVAMQNIKDFAKPIEITFDNNKELYWRWYLVKNEDIRNIIQPSNIQTEKPIEQEEKTEVSKDPNPSKEEKTEVSKEDESSFTQNVEKFFINNQISILNREIKRTNSEIEYEVLVPSAVGKIHYYAIAKSKKKINDSDLSQIFVNATIKKLPALFIHVGEMTKKAKTRLRDEFRLITTYRI